MIEAIARERGKTPAQVVLAWHVQLGLIAIPRTSNPSRLPENLDVFDLELTHEDLDRLATLDRDGAVPSIPSRSATEPRQPDHVMLRSRRLPTKGMHMSTNLR